LQLLADTIAAATVVQSEEADEGQSKGEGTSFDVTEAPSSGYFTWRWQQVRARAQYEAPTGPSV